LPSGHENFHDDALVVTLWMFPGLSVRKFGPAAWQVSYAISLRYQSKSVFTVARIFVLSASFNCCCTPQGLLCPHCL